MPIPQKLDTWLLWSSRHSEPTCMGAAHRGASLVEGSVMGTCPPGVVPPVLDGANTSLTGKSGHTLWKVLILPESRHCFCGIATPVVFFFFPSFYATFEVARAGMLPWTQPLGGTISRERNLTRQSSSPLGFWLVCNVHTAGGYEPLD